MPRPIKFRRVCCLPENKEFGPLNNSFKQDDLIILLVDEFEAVRLIDLEGFTQEECSDQMGVARTTVQGIYISARKKLADALINGKKLLVEGGQYKVCDGNKKPCGKACRKVEKRGD